MNTTPKTGNIYLNTIQESCIWIENKITALNQELYDKKETLPDAEFYFKKGELSELYQFLALLTR